MVAACACAGSTRRSLLSRTLTLSPSLPLIQVSSLDGAHVFSRGLRSPVKLWRPQAIVDARKALADARSAQKGAHLQGAVDVRSIIKKADALPEVEKVALGPDFDDEEEVPPLQ